MSGGNTNVGAATPCSSASSLSSSCTGCCGGCIGGPSKSTSSGAIAMKCFFKEYALVVFAGRGEPRVFQVRAERLMSIRATIKELMEHAHNPSDFWFCDGKDRAMDLPDVSDVGDVVDLMEFTQQFFN